MNSALHELTGSVQNDRTEKEDTPREKNKPTVTLLLRHSKQYGELRRCRIRPLYL